MFDCLPLQDLSVGNFTVIHAFKQETEKHTESESTQKTTGKDRNHTMRN